MSAMNFDSRARQFFFRNKDLLKHTLENLNIIEIQAVARTSKTFSIAAQKAEYEKGFVLFASGNLVPEYPKVFLEDEMDFRSLTLSPGCKIISFPLPKDCEVFRHIDALILTAFKAFPENAFEILNGPDGGIVEAVHRIHPLLVSNEINFPEVDSIYFHFPEVDYNAIENLEMLSRHTKRAENVVLREYMDPAIWEYLDLTKVRFFDLTTANWFGKFSLPENSEKLPALQYLLVEFSSSSEAQEIDLSRLNSYPSLVSLLFDFEIDGGEFPESLTLPPMIEHVSHLCIRKFNDDIFSESCKNRIQQVIRATPNLQIFASDQDLEFDLPRGCEMKTEDEFFTCVDQLH